VIPLLTYLKVNPVQVNVDIPELAPCTAKVKVPPSLILVKIKAPALAVVNARLLFEKSIVVLATLF
jgi:hypothetical protein